MLEIASGLKAAYDIARSAKDVHDQVRLNTAISEILEQLSSAQLGVLELQEKYQKVVEENRELKVLLEKARRFDDYQLEKTPLGGFILRLKDGSFNPENPSHAICTNCKEDGKVSVLQEYDTHYYCHSCKANVPHTQAPSLTSDWDPYDH